MSDMSALYIFGSSGHAREIAAYVRALTPTRPILFVDPYASGQDIISLDAYYTALQQRLGETIIGAGSCSVRRKMLLEARPPFATVIHPSATVMGPIGAGCVVAPGAVVAPHAILEDHVLVNYNATVGHDTVVASLAVISPGAAIGGWCSIERAVYIGAGALIRERLRIGHDAVVGMGAVVVKDVPPEVIATGVPATWKPRSS